MDGRYGYTDAQYANSAYRAKGWYNRAEMVAGGTIRVMRGKVVNEGDEILFAYHGDYWRRWGPERKRCGRKRRAPVRPAVDGDDEGGPHDGAEGGAGRGLGEGDHGSGPHDGASNSGAGVGEVDRGQGRSVRQAIDFWERMGEGGMRGGEDGQEETRLVVEGEGIRVGAPARGRGRGRAGRPRTRVVMDTSRGRRRAETAYMWSPTNRDAYERSHSEVPQRFERGEGGSYNEGA